ncbi:MAG: hypothetical protein A2694_03030 [Candidatus Blackburnbacteria bacterium RIFCSPHIGHO2_01_FULL_40_17]|uniref:Photosystem I assembly BtpA n=1 Tax=Candidatus Blackburnbacteria bacterium RIFCSPLOWO2_01_FULL_40_20 TaxID=1797519 RepID=A0A1G1VB45_9BACT|nr:MAG: hypothetical protein A2694_03030 [Candidatus Blackburnbacteria bacterium RIFCSPHIGHO2_01_FULL_40_17]OGY12501.1 MAG: hypothetical protein A3A77_00825 [Candidatus Blackburnbacteria bacterium RIFCSPLOWO2_01_FULL_40_20]
MDKFEKIFKTRNPIIGVLHFMPLLGYEGYPGIDKILENALYDLQVLEQNGVDGVIVENNYDVPHKIKVGPETVAAMTLLTSEIIKRTRLPIGVSVLWNDYEAALSIAKVCGGKFIRIPVFVDEVETNYGQVLGSPKPVVSFQNKIDAKDILLLTDIHVKHAKILSKDSIEESAKKAIENGSGALVVTGKWTADAPNVDDLEKVRSSVGDFPIIVGSGADQENIKLLLEYVDGVIVSTSLKTGNNDQRLVNIKNYDQRIDAAKTRNFVDKFKISAKKST